jgi:putative transposase
MFDNMERFSNPKRKHTDIGMLSPVDVEPRQQKLNQTGAQETRGGSIPPGTSA